jgi:hypothetical protein
MADNVTFAAGNNSTPPDGFIASTDDCGASGHAQRVKLSYSADGVATHVPADADGLLVNLGANNDVTVTGSVTANAGTNLNTSALALESGGNLAAAVTALQLLDNAVAGSEFQVDIVAALPAGTNNIGDVDVLSVVPGTAATSLGKAVDSAAGGTDTGVALLVVRDDSLATLTPADGDYTHLRVNSTGALHVTGAGGGTQYVEDVAHVTADTGTMALVVRQDANTSLVDTDGDYAPLQVNSTGSLKTTVTSGSITVANEVDTNVLSVIPGTGATNLGKAEDGAHTTGDVGVMALAVRQNTQSDFGADGDYVPLSVADDGGVRVSSTNTAAASPIAVRISDGSAFPTPGSDYTHDAALTVATTAGPALIARASTAAPTAVSVDDAVLLWATLNGALAVAPVASIAGGATGGKLVSAASTNATNIKNAAGKLLMLTASNVNADERYLKVYNTAGAPTVGTDTPVFTFIIPGNAAGAGTNIPIPSTGINFSTGISIALTVEATDAGTTGVAANEIVVNYAYI